MCQSVLWPLEPNLALGVSVQAPRGLAMRRAVSTDGVVSLGDASRVSATILVVEDEVLVRLMLADRLRETGYTVIEAAGADEALAILQSGTKVHIVFTDINMPGSMDGIGLARIVCSKCPDIDVLMTSAHQGSTELDLRIKGFFPKPYDMQTVIAHIKSLFELRHARSNSTRVKERLPRAQVRPWEPFWWLKTRL